VLVAELGKQGVLESAQRRVLVARNGQSRGLVAGGVDLDLMFQRIVVEIVYNRIKLDMILYPFSCPLLEGYLGGAGHSGGDDIRRLHSGTDSLSS
jgi:hypothetical protein